MLKSPYCSKAATSFSPKRAINTGSDYLKMARPQSDAEVKNEQCYTSTLAYAFMACTGVTDFYFDFVTFCVPLTDKIMFTCVSSTEIVTLRVLILRVYVG
jgi:hypothetical protein